MSEHVELSSLIDTIQCCDIFELCDKLPDHCVDLILADLPYGSTNCHWDTVIPFAPMWERFKRVIKPRGAIVLTASQPFTSALVMSNVEMFRYEWIWEKDRASGFLDAKEKPLKAHESILVFGVNLPRYFPEKTIGHPPVNRPSKRQFFEIQTYRGALHSAEGGSTERYPRSVVEFNVVNSAHEAIHPTQKPVALFEYLIRTYTREGELVLDPVCGSGTTALAARNAKRHWLCGDSDSHFCDVARDRLRLPFEPRRVPQNDDVSHLPLFASGGEE